MKLKYLIAAAAVSICSSSVAASRQGRHGLRPSSSLNEQQQKEKKKKNVASFGRDTFEQNLLPPTSQHEIFVTGEESALGKEKKSVAVSHHGLRAATSLARKKIGIDHQPPIQGHRLLKKKNMFEVMEEGSTNQSKESSTKQSKRDKRSKSENQVEACSNMQRIACGSKRLLVCRHEDSRAICMKEKKIAYYLMNHKDDYCGQCNEEETTTTSSTTTTPICATGYELVDGVCTDIDECLIGTHSCHPDKEVCFNVDSSYICMCDEGYEDIDGVCIDIDECFEGTNDCSPDSEECINEPGSYSCACAQGYQDIDGVCVVSDCGPTACVQGECLNGNCVCDVGWKGGDCNTDVDECLEGTSTCNAEEVCSNTEGSFICKNSLRLAIEQVVPEFVTSYLDEEVYNIMASDSPDGYIPGSLTFYTPLMDNMADTTFQASRIRHENDAAVGDLLIEGMFVPDEVVTSWPIVARLYSYLGLISAVEVNPDTGYFGMNISDIPEGLNPNFLSFTSATVFSPNVQPLLLWTLVEVPGGSDGRDIPTRSQCPPTPRAWYCYPPINWPWGCSSLTPEYLLYRSVKGIRFTGDHEKYITLMKFYSNALFLPYDGSRQYDHSKVITVLDTKASCRPDYTCYKEAFLDAYCHIVYYGKARKWLGVLRSLYQINSFGIAGATTYFGLYLVLVESAFTQLSVFNAYSNIEDLPAIAESYMNDLMLCTPEQTCAPPPPIPPPAPAPLPYESRSEWNAKGWNWSGGSDGSCKWGGKQMNNPKKITIHHTATRRSYTALDAQLLHQGWNWCDIGYHFLVDYRGTVFQGRPFQDDKEFGGTAKTELPSPGNLKLVEGAHVLNYNEDNIGINLIGCFDPVSEKNGVKYCATTIGELHTLPRDSAQYISLIRILTYVCEEYNITPDRKTTIFIHGDFQSNACPGKNVIDMIPSIIEDVKAALKAR